MVTRDWAGEALFFDQIDESSSEFRMNNGFYPRVWASAFEAFEKCLAHDSVSMQTHLFASPYLSIEPSSAGQFCVSENLVGDFVQDQPLECESVLEGQTYLGQASMQSPYVSNSLENNWRAKPQRQRRKHKMRAGEAMAYLQRQLRGKRSQARVSLRLLPTNGPLNRQQEMRGRSLR